MAQHYLRLENQVQPDNEDTNFEDILRRVGDDDELIISMNYDEIENSDHIFDILKSNGFEVLPKGGHDDDEYHIIAQRKKKN